MQRASDIRKLARRWIVRRLPAAAQANLVLGLPEWDDRSNLWRVAIVHENSRRQHLGELRVDSNGNICREPSPSIVLQRLQATDTRQKPKRPAKRNSAISFPPASNRVILGDCKAVLADFLPNSVQLVVTSPPYFNAKPEYTEYVDYGAYLDSLRRAFDACHAVLAEGRFLIVNVSPVPGPSDIPKHSEQTGAHSV